MGSTLSNIKAFKKVISKINDKSYVPLVGKVFDVKDVKKAHQYVDNRSNFGKVVLSFN